MDLTRKLSEHFSLNKSRLNVLTSIINGLLLNRGVHYRQLAEGISSNIKLDSKIKSVYRFLGGEHLSDNSYYSLIRSMLPEQKLSLAIDRTTWEFGKVCRNIFTISACMGGIAVPIMFVTLPHKGASNGTFQIQAVKSFVEKFGIGKIGMVLADREFDNKEFITYLDDANIPFCIRVRKHNRVKNKAGQYEQLNKTPKLNAVIKTEFYDRAIALEQAITASGDLISVVSSTDIENPLSTYSKRWEVETAFKACKGNGFKMEETHITNEMRFANLIKCIFIAFIIAVKVGLVWSTTVPIKFKHTKGYKAMSYFQYGLHYIKESYLAGQRMFKKIINLVFKPCFFVQC